MGEALASPLLRSMTGDRLPGFDLPLRIGNVAALNALPSQHNFAAAGPFGTMQIFADALRVG
jgi:hypothetical protein